MIVQETYKTFHTAQLLYCKSTIKCNIHVFTYRILVKNVNLLLIFTCKWRIYNKCNALEKGDHAKGTG